MSWVSIANILGIVGGELDSVDSSLAVMDVKVSCPVCSAMYPQDYIEVHASTCGERCEGAPNMDLNIAEQQHDKQNSKGLTQWKRQKKSSPKNPLRVTFIGEPGIDSGALMKEFLTEMMAGIEAKFFEGGKFGKNLKYSITDFQKDNFRLRQQTLQHCWTSLKEWWLVEGSNSTENRGEDDNEQGDKMGDYTSGDEQQEKITVSSFMQWLTGQGHIPISFTQREKFKIHVEFNHDCQLQYGQQHLCCPLVNTCSCTMTLPTQHLGNYKEFLCIMRQAVSKSKEFGRS
ncbi:hypothetical protein ROHU_028271 [Labeo rohita]|uniref:HECT domain-containing protein n=1 Tax=Labeo rohita TaxID=84645 RepID=A0A498M3U5_LABRO|nr:hypothetical protein ROHU_028271 [Labeo rohita]